jgi:hypothetical protein
MDCVLVLRRLSEIERAIGVLDSFSVRRMVIETQDYILQLQGESVKDAQLNDSRAVAGNSLLSVDRQAS